MPTLLIRRPFSRARTRAGVAALVLALNGAAALAAGSGDHTHEPPPSGDDHGHASEMSGGDSHGDSGHGGGHAHDQWVDPPAAYQALKNPDWNDPQSAINGGRLFLDNCASCHGVDGRGTGQVAKALDHPPADLTNHFHRSPGLGDGYLFWRVTKGGQVEPFKSQGSAMPAFESTLSEQERWDVLTFVHQLFHDATWEDHDPDNGDLAASTQTD